MDDNYEMTQGEIAVALNEWMRRFAEDPEAFERDITTVRRFLAEGEDASYGAESAAYLLMLHKELTAQ